MVFRKPTRLVRWRPSADPVRSTMEFGEIEAALVDRLCPEEDEWSPEVARLRAATCAAARGTRPEISLPSEPICVSVPEGYAYYALDPLTYADAAREFWRQRRPADVACVGIRSIGTSLSAFVGAALEECGVRVRSYTVRPQGHPFERRLRVGPRLKLELRALADRARFAVVDEGPGLSGSSFAAVAGELAELGVPDDRIVLFPSWAPDGSQFVSRRAAERWAMHQKYCGSFRAPADWVEFGEGGPHQAAKFREGPYLWKFEGLASYGEARFERARVLAEAGFSPKAYELCHGYIRFQFVGGRKRQPEPPNPDTIAKYLALRTREFRVSEGTAYSELARMIEVNQGREAPPLPEAGPTVITDARMRPDKWLGSVKIDSVDHGDNHFYPGPTDIAWDVAGTIQEFHWNTSTAEHFVDRYTKHSGDRDIRGRLEFFQAAYSAFQDGYGAMYDYRTNTTECSEARTLVS